MWFLRNKTKKSKFNFNEELDKLNINGSKFIYMDSRPIYSPIAPKGFSSINYSFSERKKMRRTGFLKNEYQNTYSILINYKKIVLTVYNDTISLFDESRRYQILKKIKKPENFCELNKFKLFLNKY